MKKAIKLSILLIVSILLTSCGYSFNKFYPALSELGIYKSNEDKIKDKFEELITAIDEENSETICSLFSESTKNYVGDSFEDSVNELIQYCEGDLQSWEQEFSSTYTAEGLGDHKYRLMEDSFKVITTEHKLQFYMKWTELDRENPSEVGINFLYVTISNDEEFNQYYGGAAYSKKAPGIHVGVKNHSRNP